MVKCNYCEKEEVLLHDRYIYYKYKEKNIKEHEIYSTCKECGNLMGGVSKCLEINGVKIDENV